MSKDRCVRDRDRAYKLVQQKKFGQAHVAAKKAVHYSPNNPDSHSMLGFLSYLTGDKSAALEEFEKAKKLDENFRKQWDSSVRYFTDFQPILNDKEFMTKLFPGKLGRTRLAA